MPPQLVCDLLPSGTHLEMEPQVIEPVPHGKEAARHSPLYYGVYSFARNHYSLVPHSPGKAGNGIRWCILITAIREEQTHLWCEFLGGTFTPSGFCLLEGDKANGKAKEMALWFLAFRAHIQKWFHLGKWGLYHIRNCLLCPRHSEVKCYPKLWSPQGDERLADISSLEQGYNFFLTYQGRESFRLFY